MAIDAMPQTEPFDETQFIRDHNLTVIPGQPQVEQIALRDDIVTQIPNATDLYFFNETLQIVKRYRELKIIQDSFGTDHAARRIWRMEMSKKYGKPFIDFYQSDKMRGNKVASCVGYLETCLQMASRILPDSPVKEELVSLQSKIPDITKYNAMTVEEKRQLVALLDAIGGEFISILS